jgi:hypothetical protein
MMTHVKALADSTGESHSDKLKAIISGRSQAERTEC